MNALKKTLSLVLAALLAAAPIGYSSNHREAPITALDHKADITDLYGFVSYGPSGTNDPRFVTLIMSVDPFMDPANGPNWFPFDPEILYEIKVDNNHDAEADITFQFRFQTEQRLPGLFQVFAGAGPGVAAPANSPAPVPPGALIVPPRITSFDSPGLGQRQTYTITMIQGRKTIPLHNSAGKPFYAVPANPGPRTMDYAALFNEGVYSVPGDIKVFAGATDDAFWIDLGGAFDTFNLRAGVAPGALSPAQDAASLNFASDTISGFAVNSIAVEVPIEMLTATGRIEPPASPHATIGIWGTTSRPQITVRRVLDARDGIGPANFRQVQRVGNPLINELLIGTGFKDRFSMDEPKNDSQFAPFFLDPALARVINALTGGVVAIPAAPRLDLLPVVTYAPPIASPGTPAGPIADLLRLNTGVPPTPYASASRLGLPGGDAAGFPNGRRVFDDVTDIALRLVVGGVLAAPFPGYNAAVNARLGDGVNVNDAVYRTAFPYLADSPSGRDRRHIDPGEAGCTAGLGPACPF